MFVVLGPLLLALAAIGIYGVVWYGVAQRTTEIGVRLALGATGPHVVSEVVSETLRVVAAGAVIGWLAVYLVKIHIAPGRPIVSRSSPACPRCCWSRGGLRVLAAGSPCVAFRPLVALSHE